MNHAQFWGGAAAAPYEIEQSLRFRGGAEVSRGVSSLSANTTFSAWFKLGHSTNDFHLLNFDQSGTSRLQVKIEVSAGGYIRACTQGSCSNSSALFRDYSGWYHVVIQTTSSATNVYVNNVLALTRSQPASGTNGLFIETGFSTSDSSGYVAEAYFVDGSALAPTTFAEYDDNGVWRPIEVTGLTYGTNGFYLKFDPSATNGIGHDHSGNGNNYNVSGFTTSGTGTDVMSDTPTNNWCTLNPVGSSATGGFSEGNLNYLNGTTAVWRSALSTFAVSSGKWYFEAKFTTAPASSRAYVGISPADVLWVGKTLQFGSSSVSGSYGYYSDNGKIYLNTTGSTYGASYGLNDLIGVALDLDNGTLHFYKNGTDQGEAASGLTGTWIVGVSSLDRQAVVNFGQRAFEQTPPTGFKALNTSNLPAPDIANGSDYFNTVLYTGTGSSLAVTGVGFEPDFIWFKNRSNAANHSLVNQVTDAYLASDRTEIEAAASDLTFQADGFTLSASSSRRNTSTQTYVAWNWLASNTSGSSNTNGSITSTVSANTTAGFSIVTYTGTLANATVGHGLGVAPSMIICKQRSGAVNDWGVYHASLGNGKFLKLNTTDSQLTASTIWNSTSPTSTVFSLGTSNIGNNSAPTIAFCFAEVEGYSKFGSYTGNGSTDGPFVYCGFRPAFVMTKNTVGTQDWQIRDDQRLGYNPTDRTLAPNDSRGENGAASSYEIDFLSNGFKIRGGLAAINGSGNSIVFAAFASSPFGGSGVSPATAR